MTAHHPVPPPSPLGTELVERILRDFPDHRPGTRPIHSFGAVAEGLFRPTELAGRLTTATPFRAPGPVPVTVRFSKGTADAGEPDARRSVQGMATRFHGGEGDAFDLVAMTLPVFFVRTIEAFRELTTAAEPPDPPPPRSRWRVLVDLLNLRSRVPDPAPGDPGVAELSVRRPEACPAIVAQLNAGTPESFATRSYHAVHAFRLTAADGASCFVRFSWEPFEGVRNTTTNADCFLQRELVERGRRAPVRFVLRATVADTGDDTADPTRPWPRSRRRLVLGHLALDRFPGHGGEELELNPHRLPDGIAPDPADEIFRVRGEVYATSARWRKELRESLGPLSPPTDDGGEP